MAKRDLFDDSVMSFGEHLEELRIHLIRALLGLAVAVVITMACGEYIIKIIRQPIDDALSKYSLAIKKDMVTDDVKGFNFFETVWGTIKNQFYPDSMGNDDAEQPGAEIRSASDSSALQKTVTLSVNAYELVAQLHELLPSAIAAPTDALKEHSIVLDARSDDFAGFRKELQRLDDPITLNVQEAFMTYVKVSMISGLILASPWVIYQLWLFVAAGLYPHERKYVYTYLPISIILFLGGAAFCFFFVIPPVLNFLLGFNVRMDITAQIRISEWINFAVLMPLLFGISFQLPLVMLFLNKINIFQVPDYREKRRLAVLAIAFLAMLLTPTPDPFSMLLMMGPMVALYELGIVLCEVTREKSEADSAVPA